MLIELKEPFRSKWRKGYFQTHPSGRNYICLFNNDKERTIISYARYLISVELGYELSLEYDVDHINNDKTDDRIENLQILTKSQNQYKEINRYIDEEQIFYGFCCANCNVRFILTKREIDKRISQNVIYAFCSRRCAAMFHHKLRKGIELERDVFISSY